MKLLKIVSLLLTLLTCVSGEVAVDSTTRLRLKIEQPQDNGPKLATEPTLGASNPSLATPLNPNAPASWLKAACRGARLDLAMRLDREGAAKHVTPLDSQWDGDLVDAMKTWGYNDVTDSDSTVDANCDMHEGHYIEHAFQALGISPMSAGQGGPNKCYKWVHRDGQAILKPPPPNDKLPDVFNQKYRVNGKEYRVTNAEFTIGVNALDGIIFFINLISPVQGAKKLWYQQDPPKDALPAIRSSSDVAWGLWNRACNALGKDIKNIKKFMSLTITNDETDEVIYEALRRVKPTPLEYPAQWPGTTWDTTSEEGQALLGSNNGIAAGYFLAQHKNQLGNKYIPKITIFTPSYDEIIISNMLMWVEDVPPKKPGEDEDPMDTGPGSAANIMDSHIVKRSGDGKNIVREHVIRAKM